MINKINLKNIRCFKNVVFDIYKDNVIITGPNAIGKTSILEAIYLVSLTKSHRTNILKDIIKENEMFGDIKINTSKEEYRIVISEQGKMITVNKNEISKISE